MGETEEREEPRPLTTIQLKTIGRAALTFVLCKNGVNDWSLNRTSTSVHCTVFEVKLIATCHLYVLFLNCEFYGLFDKN